MFAVVRAIAATLAENLPHPHVPHLPSLDFGDD